MGCLTNAKQSMLTTTIPAALSRGAVLVSRARADRLVWQGSRVSALECTAMRGSGYDEGSARVRVTAKHFVSRWRRHQFAGAVVVALEDAGPARLASVAVPSCIPR